jgi:hypothetical protein
MNISRVVEPEKPKNETKVAPPSEVRPTLAPGKEVSGQADLPPNTKRLNLTEMKDSSLVQVTSNLNGNPDVSLTFDEVESTLVKSDGINPFRITFQFSQERLIKGIKILSTFSDYGWAVQIDGGERLVVDSVVDGQFSTIAWPAGVKVKNLSVEVLRKVRDNYVHLNEVEIYE